jgi:hypothetical protein
MPGNFKARKKDGVVVGLRSFGAAEVRLSDKATGRKLQVAAGKTVTVSFQTLSSATVAEAAPWRYDEDAAEWIEEGTGSLTAGRYDIQAGHLSWWNCDTPDPAPKPGEKEGGGGGCANGWSCVNAFCTCSQEPTPAGIDPSAGKVPGCVRGKIDFPTTFTPSDSFFSMFVKPLNTPRLFAGNIRVAADGTFCTAMPGSYPFQLHNPTRGADASCPHAVIPAPNTPFITPGPFGFGTPDPSCGGGGCEDLGTLSAFCALS